MAYINERRGANGSTRYTVYIRDENGRRRSVGTFATRREAEAMLERKVASTELLTLRDYVLDEWLPKSNLSPATRRNYRSVMVNHILPEIGHLQVREVNRARVRDLTRTLRAGGVSRALVHRCKVALGSAFASLAEYGVVEVNPAHGVKIERPLVNDRHLLTPEEFRRIYDAMPSEGAQLFTLLLVETGARYGEATELRVDDIDWRTGTVYIRRAVSDVGSAASGSGRFVIRETPKGGRSRISSLRREVLAELSRWVASNKIAGGGLLFPRELVCPASRPDAPTPTEEESAQSSAGHGTIAMS